MSDAPAIPTTEELHAFADGLLATERRSAIESWLASRPDEAARVADYSRINAELHRLYDPVLSEPVPAAWQEQPRRRWLPSPAHMAVAAGWLALGLVGGWLLRDAMIAPPRTSPSAVALTPPLSTQAAIAHSVFVVEVRHPVEVAANEEEHLVAWLSKRMGRALKAPRLDSHGFKLVGGRLLPAAEGGVACQFMYEQASGKRITLFIKSAPGASAETAFHFAEREGVSTFYWLDGPLGYALSGDLDRDALLRLARQVYEQINS